MLDICRYFSIYEAILGMLDTVAILSMLQLAILGSSVYNGSQVFNKQMYF